jgi:hypothetical protein
VFVVVAVFGNVPGRSAGWGAAILSFPEKI